MNNHDRIKIIIIYVIGLILILRTLLFQLNLYHIYQYYLLVRLAYLVPSPLSAAHGRTICNYSRLPPAAILATQPSF